MTKCITNFLIIFFIFQQLKSQISKIDQTGYKPFCDESLQFHKIEISTRHLRYYVRGKSRRIVTPFVWVSP